MRSRLTISISALFFFGGFGSAPTILSAETKPGLRDEAKQSDSRDAHGDVLPKNAVARLGTIRLRPGERTLSLAYSPDGKFIATGANWGSCSVRLWNAATGEEIALIYTPDGPHQVQRVFFSPDGRFLTFIAKGGLHLWDVAAKRSVLLPVDLGHLAFSPDTRLLAGGHFKEFVIFDFEKRVVRFRLDGPKEWIRAVAFSPDGKLVATAEGRDFPARLPGIIRLWDVQAGKQLVEWEGHERRIDSLNFSPDGKVLASAGLDTVRLWDTENHEEIASLGGKASLVAYSPNGKLLATAGFSGAVFLWNPFTHKQVRSIQTGAGWVKSLAFSPDGKKLVTGGTSHALQLWEVESGRQVLPLTGHESSVISLQFSPDGNTLASYGDDLTVRLWALASNLEQRRFLLGSEGDITGNPSNTLPVCSLAFAPDGKRLAAIGVPKRTDPDNPLHLWDVGTGNSLFVIQTPRRKGAGFRLSAIAFSSDGETLAAVNGGAIQLWSATSAARLPARFSEAYRSVAFAPDGRIIAAGEFGPRIQLWDGTGSRLLRSFPCQKKGASCIAFSPDGHILASTSYEWKQQPSHNDSTIQLRESATGTWLRTLVGHEDSAACIAFSPNGRLLASAGPNDRTVRLWDVFTGKELAKFTGHRGPVYCVAFSPDGRTVASGSSDTTILLWDVSGLQVKPPPTPTDAESLARLWNDMKHQQAAIAYPALWSFAGADNQAVAFLQQHLRPASAADAEHVRQLIADLDASAFQKRQTATEQLTKLGWSIEPALRQALDAKPEIEVRKRLEQLLADIAEWPTAGEYLRQVRALHALELLGSPAARDLLQKLADGAPGAALTRDAKFALQRLERRAKKP